MENRVRSEAALPAWVLVGTAGLAATLSFTAVHASRNGCIGGQVADLPVGGIAGLGLAISALLVVSALPRHRRLPLTVGAVGALALSLYAVVAFLLRDPGACTL